MNQKYLIYICPSCKTSLALEQKTPPKNFCKHIVKRDNKFVKCGYPLPTQKTRNMLEIEQYHAKPFLGENFDD